MYVSKFVLGINFQSINLLDYTNKDWEELKEETFNQLFKHSAVKRTKFKGLKRNINFLKS